MKLIRSCPHFLGNVLNFARFWRVWNRTAFLWTNMSTRLAVFTSVCIICMERARQGGLEWGRGGGRYGGLIIFQDSIANHHSLALVTFPALTTYGIAFSVIIHTIILSLHESTTRSYECYISDIVFFSSYLSGNQLTCDCKLLGVHNASLHLSKFTGTCYKPDKLSGKDIASLQLKDFCRKCFIMILTALSLKLIEQS